MYSLNEELYVVLVAGEVRRAEYLVNFLHIGTQLADYRGGAGGGYITTLLLRYPA